MGTRACACVRAASICVGVCILSTLVCEHTKVCVLEQANLSKQVFVITSGLMTFGLSLESTVTSCGGDGRREGKELTKKVEETLAG